MWSVEGVTKLVAYSTVLVILVHRLIIAIYNIYFHPLSKFPGPAFAAASFIPYAWHLSHGNLAVWTKQLHDEYSSEVVRLSPNDLSFTAPSAWKDISGYRAGHRPYEKDAAVYGKAQNGVDTLLIAKKPDHARMRRVLDHAFSAKALKEQTPVILSYVDRFVELLFQRTSSQGDCEIDLAKWFNWMSFDLIGDLAFGESFSCLESEENHPWLQMVFGNLQGIVWMGALSRFLPMDSILPYILPAKVKKMMEDHWVQTQAKLQRRLAKGTQRPDFITPILENDSPKGGLKEGEMESNASLFIIAGSDSIAGGLTGVIYYLLKNPWVLEKLRAEINEAFGEDKEITLQKVEKLAYMVAVLDEAMRIYPIALAGQAHVVPPEGDDIASYWVPGGTGVSMNQYAVFRSASNFTYPDTFIPERWLSDTFGGATFTTDRKDAFHPFSLGPRNCIGKLLGLAVPRLTLAKLLFHFDLELSPETDSNWADQKAFIVWQKKPLIVKLTPRNGRGRKE